VQILVIAVLMKGILHRSFSIFQWEALVLLVAGITVNQLNYCTKDGGGACASSRHLPILRLPLQMRGSMQKVATVLHTCHWRQTDLSRSVCQ